MNKPVTKAKFSSSPLVDFLQKERCKNDVLLRKAVTSPINDILFQDIDWRFGINGQKNHDKNLILTIFGETGTGKSNNGIYICDYISSKAGQNFSEKDICFSTTELLDRIKDVFGFDNPNVEFTDKEIEENRGKCFILDEQKRGNFGVGAFREQEEKKTIMDIFRKLQTCTVFIAPDIHNNPTTHYYLEAWGICPEHDLSKSILYDKVMIPRGYVITRKASDKIWKPYSEKKNKFITSVIMGQDKSRSNAMVGKAKEIVESRGWELAKSKEEKKQFVAMNFPSLAISETESIVAVGIMIDRAKKEGMDIEDMIIERD